MRLTESAECVGRKDPEEPRFSEVKDEYLNRVLGPLFHILRVDQWKNIEEIGLNSKNVFSQSRNKKCPKKINTKSIKYGHMSTCPSDIKFTYDENRLPIVLPFAVCRCTHCIPVDGCDEECRSQTTCQPVYTYKTIYRKQCTSREIYEWISDVVKIPVGCTCGVKHEPKS